LHYRRFTAVVKQAAWDAVIFDYGGVLCYAPARQDVAECAECSGLDEETFYKLYTGTRQYYGLAAAAYKAHWHRVAKGCRHNDFRSRGETVHRQGIAPVDPGQSRDTGAGSRG
jgi:hypothetical protein